MKAPNITQGNWEASESIRSGYTIWADHRDCVAREIDDEARYGSIAKKEDAQAIAAVPDLIYALIGMLDLVETAVTFEGDTVRKARAALLKAGCTE